MKYTLYILRCLHTGAYRIGMTSSLRKRMAALFERGRGQPQMHLELLHVEQFFDRGLAHRRLQTILRRWGQEAGRASIQSEAQLELLRK